MITLNGNGNETGRENLPSRSVEVPVVVPFTTTVAPIIASPVFASAMVPLIVWAYMFPENINRNINRSLCIRFQIYMIDGSFKK